MGTHPIAAHPVRYGLPRARLPEQCPRDSEWRPFAPLAPPHVSGLRGRGWGAAGGAAQQCCLHAAAQVVKVVELKLAQVRPRPRRGSLSVLCLYSLPILSVYTLCLYPSLYSFSVRPVKVVELVLAQVRPLWGWGWGLA